MVVRMLDTQVQSILFLYLGIQTNIGFMDECIPTTFVICINVYKFLGLGRTMTKW